MALVRCKSCGIDTSDSLERCPNCGGSTSGLRLASVVAAATEAASRAAEGADKAEAATQALTKISPQLLRVPRIVWTAAVLFVLAVVPHAFPILVAAAILWTFSRGRQASQKTHRSLQSEVLQAFKNQASSARRAAAGRPLERLRAIEQATLKRDA
jgi:flagellar biosynthesis component FlhA